MDNQEIASLTYLEAAIRIEELRSEINRHNRLYYEEDNPLIPDEAYDALMRRLRAIEAVWPELSSENSPSRVVGGAARRTLREVAHRVPMLSLQDVFSETEVREFVARIQEEFPDPVFIVERKIDGLSVGLRYEQGRLALGLTRGDGVHTGEDVTDNLRQIKSLPLVIPEPVADLEIRGEVYLPIAAFEKVNARQEETGGKIFANPPQLRSRHAAAAGSGYRTRTRTGAVYFQLAALPGPDLHIACRKPGMAEQPGISDESGLSGMLQCR